RLAACAATPAVLFYLITDCVFLPGMVMYPKTVSGQIESYIAALPFLAKMLASDMLFSGLIFGTYWLAVSSGVLASRELEPVPLTEEMATRGQPVAAGANSHTPFRGPRSKGSVRVTLYARHNRYLFSRFMSGMLATDVKR